MSKSDRHVTYDIHHVRKTLIWGVPLFLCGILFGVYLTYDAWNMIARAQLRAPVVRIGVAAFTGPTFVLMMSSILIAGCARAIPLKKTFDLAERAAVVTTILGLVVMAFVTVAGRPIQSHFMPQYGYSRCSVLQGNPTVWFQDWVRNPEWCVKGKSREWVAEQAVRSTQGEKK